MSHLLSPRNFHDYQRRAIDHQISHPASLLFLFLGSGKTACTLTSINHLQRHGFIRAALVVAPLRVCQAVWEREAEKWTHLKGMRFSKVIGTPRERLRALTVSADVYLINFENLRWLKEQLQHHWIRKKYQLPFDMLVIDESTKVKNANSERVKSLLPLLQHMRRRTALTGTPAPNGLIDLHGQLLVMDDGLRLGINRSDYERNYFTKDGGNGYNWIPTARGKSIIHTLIADITLEMSAEDYIKLPPFVVHDLLVDIPINARSGYDELERDFLTELDSGVTLEVENAAAKCNKLLQYGNGAVYTDTETKAWEAVHDAKLEALDEILEEASGEPVFLGYNFRPDAARISKRFPYAVNMTGMSGKQFNQTITDFQAGKIKLLMGHPASMGHGVDGLQNSCSVITWFGIPWSLELFSQLNARIQRQGQKRPVRCYRILGRDTMDQAVSEALEYKDNTQATLRAAIKKYREERGL